MQPASLTPTGETIHETIRGAGTWQLSAATDLLAPGEVHLWRAHCVPIAVDLAAYALLLTPAEMERARRLATTALRRRYLQAHFLLHTLLAAYTGNAALPCELAYDTHGKPFLASPPIDPPLHFNMSHSGEMVLVALARGSAVGVDVEQIRPLHHLDVLIGAICNARERESLAALAEDQRAAAFLRLWTRKEAIVKLRGTGLAAGLRTMKSLEDADIALVDVPFVEGAGEYVGSLANRTSGDVPLVTCFDAVWLPA